MTEHSFTGADILLPKKDFEKWAVIACDQFTSEQDYWDETDRIVGDAPSALRITLPEIYLEKPDVEERIRKINDTMKEYLATGVLESHPDTMVYVERTQSDGTCGMALWEAFVWRTTTTKRAVMLWSVPPSRPWWSGFLPESVSVRTPFWSFPMCFS